MDEIQKSRIKLSHWIDHNLDHLKSYNETAGILEELGHADAARSIREGVALIEQSNEKLKQALGSLPGGEGGEGHHHHGHGHHHH